MFPALLGSIGSSLLGSVGSGLASGLLGAVGGNKAAQGAQAASKLQQEAANKAYEGGLYKPYGVTSGLGTASFSDDGQSSFSLDPRYQAQQNQMLGLGASAFGQAAGDYDQLADEYYNRQRALGAGSRDAEAIALRNRMFGEGNTGLRVGSEALGLGSGGMLSPAGAEFAQAFAAQDSQDRYNAMQASQAQRQADIGIGQSMLSNAMGLDQAGLAQQELGGMFGNYRSSAANAAGGNLVSGMGGAAGSTGEAGLARSGQWTGLGESLFDRKDDANKLANTMRVNQMKADPTYKALSNVSSSGYNR